MREIVICLALFIFSWLNSFSQNSLSQNSGFIYLGVLETKRSSWPENNYNDMQDSTTKKIVRVLFYKDQNEWKSLVNEIGNAHLYPSALKWFIAFDGKEIGSFHSKKEPLKFKDIPWTFPRDAYHSTIEKNLPTIGKPALDFSGMPGEENPRPLIVNSVPNCADPDEWKPFIPDKNDINTIYPVYRSYVQKQMDGILINIEDLRLLKSYQSKNRDQLIEVGTITFANSQEVITCPVWIYKSQSGEIRNLSKVIDYKFCKDEFIDDDMSECKLVDAGDYDLDGKSELIFWASRYDCDGYVMFYNDFINMIDFTWIYH